jgi:hypothetical protein
LVLRIRLVRKANKSKLENQNSEQKTKLKDKKNGLLAIENFTATEFCDNSSLRTSPCQEKVSLFFRL